MASGSSGSTWRKLLSAVGPGAESVGKPGPVGSARRKLLPAVVLAAVCSAAAAPSAVAASTADEIEVREWLVVEQEALLNEYRCRFGVDVDAVVGGCEGGRPAQQAAPAGETAYEVPVFLCAAESRFTGADLAEAVAALNRQVSPFYARESSGLVSVEFAAGGIVSPPIDWRVATMSGFAEVARASHGEQDDECAAAAVTAAGGDRQLLIYADVASGGESDYVAPGRGPVLVAVSAGSGHLADGSRAHSVARGLGTMLFGLAPADGRPAPGECEAIAWSVMQENSACGSPVSVRPGGEFWRYEVVCGQRAELGWPCKDGWPTAAAGGGPMPAGVWRAYADDIGPIIGIAGNRQWRAGVTVSATASAGSAAESEAELHVACFHSVHDDSLFLRAFVDWNRFTSPTIYNYDLDLLYSGGDEAVYDSFSSSNFDASFVTDSASATQLAEEVIARDGQTVTASIYLAFTAELLSAEFDTAGAAIAVRSVLEMCPQPTR